VALNASGHTVIIDVRIGRGMGRAKRELKDVGNAAETAGNKVRNARQNFANLAGAFTGMFVAGQVKRGFEAMLKPAIDFELSMERIKALNPQADLKKFGAEAKRVASITPYGPNELADALLRLRFATGNSEDALKALEPAATLAAASMGKMNVEQSTRVIEDLSKAWGMSGDEIGDASERIFAIAKATGQQIHKYTNVIARLAPAAQVTGQSFDEMLKQFSLTSRIIKQPERAVRLLGTAFTKMLAPRGKNIFSEQLGIDVTDAAGNMMKLSDIMLLLAKRWEFSSGSVKSALAQMGVRSIKPITAILRQLTGAFKTQEGVVLKGAEVYEHLNERVRDSAGNLRRVSEIYKQTTSGMLTLFKEKVGLLAMAFGNMLIPVLRDTLKVLEPMILKLTEFGEWMQKDSAGAWITRITFKLGLLGIGVWALRAALWGALQLIKVVAFNLGGTFVASLFKARIGTKGLTTALTWGARAAKMFWGSLTLGLVFLPEILEYLGKLKEEIGQGYKKEGLLGALKNLPFFKALKGIAEELGIRTKEAGGELAEKLKKGANHLKEASKDLVSGAKKTGELAKSIANEFGSMMKLASTDFQNILKQIKALSSYEPPEVKGKYFTSMQKRLMAAQGQVKGGDKKRITYALGASKSANALMQKAMKGTINPDEQVQLMRALETMGVVGSHISRVYGPTLMSRSLVKNFGEGVTKQVASMGDPLNRRFAETLTRAGGGEYITSGEAIPGFNPLTGGYGARVPWQYEKFHSKTFKGAGGATTGPGGQIGADVRSGGMDPVSALTVEKLDTLGGEVKIQTKVLNRILVRLGGTLKIEQQDERDPLSAPKLTGVGSGVG
jgi:TP901 family phage tail tape measure protein